MRQNFDSDEFASTYDESYNLYKKYQMKIHNDAEEACDQDAFEDFLIESPFEVLFRSDTCSVRMSYYLLSYIIDLNVLKGISHNNL